MSWSAAAILASEIGVDSLTDSISMLHIYSTWMEGNDFGKKTVEQCKKRIMKQNVAKTTRTL